MAIKGSSIELIEVELTVKKIARYKLIHSEHGRRLSEGVRLVTYFCTPAVARVVSREADKFVFRDQRDRLIVHPSLDDQGGGFRGSRWSLGEREAMSGGPSILCLRLRSHPLPEGETFELHRFGSV